MKQHTSDIETLNKLYAKYCKAQKILSEAYCNKFAEIDDLFCSKRAAYTKASQKFELFRKQMALDGMETKFDHIAGVYFLANKGNKQVFHVELKKTVSKVIEVPADNEEESLKLGALAAEALTENDKDVKREVFVLNVSH